MSDITIEQAEQQLEVDADIKKQVEGWNWNLNQFEIYDEIQDYPKDKIRALLQYAYKFFNSDSTFADLASHLDADINTEEGK